MERNAQKEQIEKLEHLIRDYHKLMDHMPHWGWWATRSLELKARAIDLGVVQDDRRKEHVG